MKTAWQNLTPPRFDLAFRITSVIAASFFSIQLGRDLFTTPTKYYGIFWILMTVLIVCDTLSFIKRHTEEIRKNQWNEK
jgi:hypothetical protein